MYETLRAREALRSIPFSDRTIGEEIVQRLSGSEEKCEDLFCTRW